MQDLIDRQEAIRAFDDAGFCTHGYIVDVLKGLPSAQPTYTDEEIQKMADLEQAEIEKAYQLGYEDGKENAQPLALTCDGCRHVGTYDTDFPCSVCIRREKDYYAQE